MFEITSTVHVVLNLTNDVATSERCVIRSRESDTMRS